MKKLTFLILILVTSLILVACTVDNSEEPTIDEGPVIEEESPILDEEIDDNDDMLEDDLDDPDA